MKATENFTILLRLGNISSTTKVIAKGGVMLLGNNAMLVKTAGAPKKALVLRRVLHKVNKLKIGFFEEGAVLICKAIIRIESCL